MGTPNVVSGQGLEWMALADGGRHKEADRARG